MDIAPRAGGEDIAPIEVDGEKIGRGEVLAAVSRISRDAHAAGDFSSALRGYEMLGRYFDLWRSANRVEMPESLATLVSYAAERVRQAISVDGLQTKTKRKADARMMALQLMVGKKSRQDVDGEAREFVRESVDDGSSSSTAGKPAISDAPRRPDITLGDGGK